LFFGTAVESSAVALAFGQPPRQEVGSGSSAGTGIAAVGIFGVGVVVFVVEEMEGVSEGEGADATKDLSGVGFGSGDGTESSVKVATGEDVADCFLNVYHRLYCFFVFVVTPIIALLILIIIRERQASQ